MKPHLLVTQLRFTRSELVRCLEGVTEEEAKKRFESMNCISWIVGHLANQESRYWNMFAQGMDGDRELNDLVGYGKPASTPSLKEIWSTWQNITKTADPFLDTLTPAILQTHFVFKGKELPESIGTLLQRNIFHYWFHTGEAFAIRQLLGHKNLPDFVGDMSTATYYPE
jgi:hypothetical protein